MQKVGSIREVSPLKNSIIFLTGSASLLTASNVVHVVSDQLLRMYDPQDRRTKEALPITACLSTQKARMETEVIPGSGWQVDVEAKTCGCRIFCKMGYCVHLLHALSARDKLDLFGRARLLYRGRDKARRERSEQ
ncbi:hypothetical protein PC129_g23383 [Phytophthora cactorum]|uniref:SWIM-type domain-containing protein n=1 Tax=Phytophthora cactorum TaxID=29920 RepID=A0A329RA05_9STRA|nr:hypothetical protein Pcac1_g24522 [Phytophthora cactorum]KAG2815771.1 hypothetical protein PC112_g13745 [Phytophthora cactorum]KAG2817953.1 hypothetical protein PC111_g12513 [Phytophthora cactorum]KAG2853688.1 hypothetical protein PC113_g13959 [Phytophthora cactorum]KAG2874070.1 hypothetical protein PC114_g25497 [Phytophthora cactorum]